MAKSTHEPGVERRLKRASKPLVAFVCASLFLVQPAQASCSVGVIPKDVFSSITSLSLKIATAGLAISYSLSQLSDALTRYANNATQTAQARNTARANQADARSVQMTSQAVGETRFQLAQDFKPSVSVCSDVSAQRRLGMTGVQYASYRTQLQNQNTAYSNNAPGSGAERGALQGFSTVWNERCNRYANPATMQIAGCPGPTDAAMRDLDVQPWKALLDPIQFANPAREQAAKDAIKMLTELVPEDPNRGNSLLRTEGQNLHVLRMRDVTRMNLVRGVLEDIAAMRSIPAGQTHSRMARFLELVEGRPFDPATGQLSTNPADMRDVSISGEGENATLQLLASRMATGLGVKFEMTRVVEQLLALEAVDLAINVERNRAGNATASSQVLQRQ